jgi:hypothetical protein
VTVSVDIFFANYFETLVLEIHIYILLACFETIIVFIMNKTNTNGMCLQIF